MLNTGLCPRNIQRMNFFKIFEVEKGVIRFKFSFFSFYKIIFYCQEELSWCQCFSFFNFIRIKC